MIIVIFPGMKKVMIALLAFIVAASCKKNDSGLTGTWRLATVYDKVDNGLVAVPKPAGETGDILLTFGRNKSYSGKTYKSTYTNGSYTLSDNRIDFSIPDFAGGPNNDEWSFAFSVMLTSCGLQSVHPCVLNTISLSNNQLTINTAMRYNLVFERVK